MKQRTYTFQFVEFIPKVLDDGVLYVSTTYATASHLCFCGCSMKVVTPLSPTDWRMSFNGDAVSLDPSIGNWSYPCRSHYILRGNQVIWAGPMSAGEIRAAREDDLHDKQLYHQQRHQAQSTQAAAPPAVHQVPAPPTRSKSEHRRRGWRRILDWF